VREVGRSQSASLRGLRKVEPKPLHNLPVQPTPLIGREREIVAVQEILLHPDVRALTLIGPGGVGKSRLGLWIASSLGEDFADGVCLVSPISVFARDYGIHPTRRGEAHAWGVVTSSITRGSARWPQLGFPRTPTSEQFGERGVGRQPLDQRQF